MVTPMTSKASPAPSGRTPRRARKQPVEFLDPRKDPASAVAFARTLVEEGEPRRALLVLAEVTRKNPLLREAWALRGALALAIGDVALAEACSIGCAAALFSAGYGAVADLRRPRAWA
jgi:Flp pilus assembly protein TadD